jgi:hypothetical protein
MANFIFDNWQFLVTLFFALAALGVSIKALIGSQRVEEEITGDAPSVLVKWHRIGSQTECTLTALSEVKDASFKLGKQRKLLTNLEATRLETLVFPVMEVGIRWELRFRDPASGKTLRQKGVVRYE